VYATGAGSTFMDRELYVPDVSWIADRARCRGAGIGDEVAFATKPAQFRAMLERARGAGVPFAWSTADEAYGQTRELREWMAAEDIHYVMATKCNDVVESCDGPRTVKDLVRDVAKHRWRRRSAGAGAHGQREYDWARIELPCDVAGRSRWVLARRSLSDGEIAYYVCFGPTGTSLDTLVRVAGTRWRVEESFKTGKGECGLDHYQVRKYDAWYRHVTLAMAAHAVLAVTRAREHEREKGAADTELVS
jgi:SRSO17 transposase